MPGMESEKTMKGEIRLGEMERLDPYRHIPKTDGDRERIIEALFWGWELMVDDSGNVWISDREEKIAYVDLQTGKEMV